MGIDKSIKKRIHWLKDVTFDKRVGFYRYNRWGYPIFIRHPRHYVDYSESLWVCRNIYFYHYLPQKGDTVVDFGAGYSEEGVFLNSKSDGFRYIGVEIQPIIYECLCNTYKHLGAKFEAVPYAISSSKKPLKVISQFSYASSGLQEEGYIEVPVLSWKAFIDRYAIEKIDLLKMNIEGAEAMLLDEVEDITTVRRVIISCHDFRADEGDGESFRTKARVLEILKDAGFHIKMFDYKISWADHWVYAER